MLFFLKAMLVLYASPSSWLQLIRSQHLTQIRPILSISQEFQAGCWKKGDLEELTITQHVAREAEMTDRCSLGPRMLQIWSQSLPRARLHFAKQPEVLVINPLTTDSLS